MMTVDRKPRCPKCNRALGRDALAAHVPTCKGPRSLPKTEYLTRGKRIKAAVMQAASGEGE